MVPPFRERLTAVAATYTRFSGLVTLQLNLGDRCPLTCRHCHVQASPTGNHLMGRETIDQVIAFLAANPGLTLDLTGGCPELHPDFRYLLERTAKLVPRRLLRSNLVALADPATSWLLGLLQEQRLVVIASLPCYLEENVDRQRGVGVYARSITALQRLNTLGYGTDLELNLVYNPGGDFLASTQEELEALYRAELAKRHGIRFNHLYCLNNAPLGRFRAELERKGRYPSYLKLLANAFNPATAPTIMCRSLVSIDWRGRLYNCDFNQAAGLPLTTADGTPLTIAELKSLVSPGQPLNFAEHCYTCTAGAGTSCTGQLA